MCPGVSSFNRLDHRTIAELKTTFPFWRMASLDCVPEDGVAEAWSSRGWRPHGRVLVPQGVSRLRRPWAEILKSVLCREPFQDCRHTVAVKLGPANWCKWCFANWPEFLKTRAFGCRTWGSTGLWFGRWNGAGNDTPLRRSFFCALGTACHYWGVESLGYRLFSRPPNSKGTSALIGIAFQAVNTLTEFQDPTWTIIQTRTTMTRLSFALRE